MPSKKQNRSITVISKEGCHICERAIRILESLKADYDFDLTIKNIEGNPLLFEKYWIKVPVIRVEGKDMLEAEDIGFPDDKITRAKFEKLLLSS